MFPTVLPRRQACRATRRATVLWLAVLLPAAGAACARASADPAARVASLGTNPPGSIFYAVGAGLAKVAAQSGGARLAVQPYAGSSTFSPLLDGGEVDFGIVNAVDMALSYRGPGFTVGGRNPLLPTPNLRLVMRGAPILVALLVRRDSTMRDVHDIRGMRVTGGYPAHLSVWYNMFGHLATGGLTWDDVRVVPVPAINDGVDALVQGRADVTEFGLNGAKVREADAAIGVRHLSNDCSAEGQARLRAAVPGYYARLVKARTAAAVTADTCVIAYDLYLATSTHADDALVRTVLEGIWTGAQALPKLHPVLREWTRERAVDPDVTLPFHPAAVAFYREQGVWTPDMARAQERLLAGGPRP